VKTTKNLIIDIEKTAAEKIRETKVRLYSKEKGVDEMKTTPCVEKNHPIRLSLHSLLYHSPSVNST